MGVDWVREGCKERGMAWGIGSEGKEIAQQKGLDKGAGQAGSLGEEV